MFREEWLIELHCLQSRILLALCILSAICTNRKIQTAKQLLRIIVIRWTTKETKIQLQVLEG